MHDPPLDIDDDLTGIGLIPAPIEVLGDYPQLDDQIAGQIRRFGLTAFFAPKPQQRLFILAHDDPGVRAADEATPGSVFRLFCQIMLHGRRRNPVASRWAVQVWFDDTVQCQNAICGLDVWGRMSFKI